MLGHETLDLVRQKIKGVLARGITAAFGRTVRDRFKIEDAEPLIVIESLR
jgi:hypothetical protein